MVRACKHANACSARRTLSNLRDDGSKLRIIHRAGSVYSEVVEILDSLTYKLIIADRVCGRLVEEGCGAACACELLHTSLV